MLRAARKVLVVHPALLDTARQDAVRLEDVADRLLDVSRSRAMSIALERQSVNLEELIARVVKLFAFQARERGVALEVASAKHAVTIPGDATKISWAVSNLIVNALRYSPSGGTVRVETAEKNGAVLLSVSDDGPGIPPEQRERIFERFAQGEGEAARRDSASPSCATSCRPTAGASTSTATSAAAAASPSSCRAVDPA